MGASYEVDAISQLMMTFELYFWLLVLQTKVPLVLSFGQYLHEAGRLQGRAFSSHFTQICDLKLSNLATCCFMKDYTYITLVHIPLVVSMYTIRT